MGTGRMVMAMGQMGMEVMVQLHPLAVEQQGVAGTELRNFYRELGPIILSLKREQEVKK